MRRAKLHPRTWSTFITPRDIMLCLLLLLIAAASAAAKKPNEQFVNISMLPGGGIAIDPQGCPDGLGALQVNVPVAYTPGNGHASLFGSWGQHEGLEETDNGTAVLAVGFFRKPAVYMSGTQVSHVWEEAKLVSGQINVVQEKDNTPAISIGIQDILEKEPYSRTVYIVATKQLQVDGRNLYATVGYGDGRFINRPFAGLSMPLGESINAAAEWDGYQLNAGLAWRPGGRYGWGTLLAAYNGKRGWLLGGGVAFSFGRCGRDSQD